jgi:hypothetical protein
VSGCHTIVQSRTITRVRGVGVPSVDGMVKVHLGPHVDFGGLMTNN